MQPSHRRMWPLVMLMLVGLLGWLGLREFERHAAASLGGVIALLLAIVCLGVVETGVGTMLERSTPVAVPVAGFRWRWSLTAVALLLAAGVLGTLFREFPSRTESGPVLPWLLAWLLLIVAWTDAPHWAAIRDWLWVRRGELLLVGAVTLAAGGVRFWSLGSAPFTLSGDEGSIGLELRRVLAGDLRNPFMLGWGPLPTLSYFVQAFPAWIAGVSPWTLRLTTALFGSLAVPLLYLLARHLFGRPTALAAAILLAGYHFHLHYSRVAINVIFDSFFYPAALVALLYGLQQRGRSWAFVLAGTAAGLAQYANVGARLLPILIVAFLLALLLLAPGWLAGQGRNLLLLGLTFLVIAGPLLVFALHHPDDYNARMNQVGILGSGWLEREQQVRGQGAAPILFDQFQRALFGFVFYADRSASYDPDGPLAGPALALLLLLGLGLSLWHWRQPGYTLVSLWFWGGLVGGGVLTVNPPTSNRLVILTPVVALLAALALVTVARVLLAALDLRLAQHWMLLIVVVVALPVALLDVRFYFRDYLPQQRFGGPHALIATTLGHHLASQPSPPHLFFFGAPQMMSEFSTLVLLAPEVPRSDVLDPVTTLTAVHKLGQPERERWYVFLRERRAELDLVRRAFPLGEMQEVPAPPGSIWRSPLYICYRVPSM